MRWLSSKRNILLFVLPSMVIFTIFIAFSVFYTLYYSFTDFSGIGQPNFVGLDNYQRLLDDGLVLNSFKNTLIILIISSAITLPVSFFLAYAFNTDFRGNVIAKALNFTPYIIAPIIVGTIWVFILDPHMGLLNGLLRSAGLENFQPQWIGGKVLTPYMIGVVYAWQCLGFYATIFLAGLKNIPRELYEASAVEGANTWQNLTRITLPLLRESIIINVLLMFTGAMKVFELVYQMTYGGPNHLSDVAVTYMHFIMFRSGKYAYGCAIAVLLLIICMIFSIFYIRNARKKLD